MNIDVKTTSSFPFGKNDKEFSYVTETLANNLPFIVITIAVLFGFTILIYNIPKKVSSSNLNSNLSSASAVTSSLSSSASSSYLFYIIEILLL